MEATTGATKAANPRALLVISAQPTPEQRVAIAAGSEPRRDYDALREALDAATLHPDAARATRIGALLARHAGAPLALAWAAFTRRHAYDVIYTDNEKVGLPLALLLALGQLLDLGRRGPRRPRYVMLTHYLTPAKKRIWFRLGIARAVDALLVHSTAQYELATRELGVPAERVLRVPYFADERFWRAPAAAATPVPAARPMICSLGLEFRDYTTLLAAVRDLDVDVRISAGSHWSRHSAFDGSPELPPNVAVQSFSDAAPRDLYAAARFVVVPLRDVNNQAGITVILEAMAMGKAVIVTRNSGQTDVIRDWRPGAEVPGFLRAPGIAETLGQLPTGCYVAPGDVAALRQAIAHLLEHPELAETLGRNGRRVVEEYFGLDAFARRFAAVLRNEPLPADVPTPD
jgi:glycosyltransferase involved in cell wall biosynthesis